MDIFDVINEILKRKANLVKTGIDEKQASKIAKFDISNEYHIPLRDIWKIYNY